MDGNARYWFWENQYRFVPIWTDFCLFTGFSTDFNGYFNEIDDSKNPFLYYYYPDNLLDLAYMMGASNNTANLDLDKQNVEFILSINKRFSYIVRHLKYWIGEFAEISG